MTRDFGQEAQRAAEKHLELVQEAYFAEIDDDDEGPYEHTITSPAVGPYCGCQTCQVREVLAGAWPVIDEYAEDYAADMRKVLTSLVETLGGVVLPQAAWFALAEADLFLEQNRVGA